MTVFLFFDESGDLNFSPNGSRYVVFGALTTREPATLLRPLSDLRYDMIVRGVAIEEFHASEDRQAVRDQVFQVLAETGGFEFDAVIVEKRKANPVLHDPARFYPQFAGYLLQYVFKRYDDPTECVVVITDTLPIKKRRKAMEKAFKSFIRRRLGRRPFSVLHHASAAHACLQAADYCNWAIYKKWKDGEMRPYRMISRFVRSEFDMLARGTEYFY